MEYFLFCGSLYVALQTLTRLDLLAGKGVYTLSLSLSYSKVNTAASHAVTLMLPS